MFNDEKLAVRVREVFVKEFGKGNVDDPEPSMGAEDFSFMLQVKPGAYLRLGQGGGAFLHNSRYDFNDDVLPLGGALLAGLVERSLPLKASETLLLSGDQR